MNPVKRTIVRTKDFVSDHKVPIAVVATATVTAVVSRKIYSRAFDVANQFIADEGLAEKFLEYVPNN